MINRIFRTSIGAASGLLISHSAYAAVPTATDDTGLAGVGVYEFSVFATGESRDSGDSYELPVVEVETGLTDSLAVFAAGARQVINPDGESSSSGWGNAEFGAKLLLWDQDNVRLAFVPTYSFGLRRSSERRGLVEDLDILSFPVVASYESGAWTFTGSVAYDMTSSSEDGIFYGFWTGYKVGNWFWLAEIYGEEVSGSDDAATNARLGFEWEFMEETNLLFSVGTGLTDDFEDDDDELDYEFFFGLRWSM
ncbi:MAG: transporter [Gammaproteobacteria bacterium]